MRVYIYFIYICVRIILYVKTRVSIGLLSAVAQTESRVNVVVFNNNNNITCAFWSRAYGDITGADAKFANLSSPPPPPPAAGYLREIYWRSTGRPGVRLARTGPPIT